MTGARTARGKARALPGESSGRGRGAMTQDGAAGGSCGPIELRISHTSTKSFAGLWLDVAVPLEMSVVLVVPYQVGLKG